MEIRGFGQDGIFAVDISIAIQSWTLLCGQLIAHLQLLNTESCSHQSLEAVWREYAKAGYILDDIFSRNRRLSALFAHLFMRPITTHIATRMLQHFPQLLAEGARWSGKTEPLRGALATAKRPIYYNRKSLINNI